MIIKLAIRGARYLYMMHSKKRVYGGGVIAFIRTDKQMYLCVCRPSWKREWEEFGGKAELGETPAEARQREFGEEAGCWLDRAGIDEYRVLGEWTLSMDINTGCRYESSQCCIMLSGIHGEADLLEWALDTYQDRGYDMPREISVDFIPLRDVTHKRGTVFRGKAHEIKLSARLRRVLKDRRVRNIVDGVANADIESSSQEDGIIMPCRSNTSVCDVVNA